MRVLITGATGFIGHHVVRALKAGTACDNPSTKNPAENITTEKNVNQRVAMDIATDIIASGRREEALRLLDCDFVRYDLNDDDPDVFSRLGRPDLLIHLAWDGLGDYRSLRHIETTLWSHYRFLKNMVRAGLPALTCVGTCHEYGRQEGLLSEESPVQPVTSYAIAKNTLRQFLDCARREHSFRFQWLRPFYLYGEGQRERSLMGQLHRAFEQGATCFPMSQGDQQRDYLPVETVAQYIVKVSYQTAVDGVIHICSGIPRTVRSVVEETIRSSGKELSIDIGRFPYPDHEPFAYWGSDRKLRKALSAYEQEFDREAA